MPEPLEDVKSDPSTDENENVVENEVVENADQDSTPEEEAPESQESPSPEGVKTGGDEDVDDKGVSWKNRAKEQERKLNDLQSNIPHLIQDAVSKAIPEQKAAPVTEPAYTKDELIRYKNSTDDSNKRAWAEIELEKLRDQGIKTTFDKQRAEDKASAKLTQDKNASYNIVRTKYPLMFNADGSWNNSHPLTQKLGRVYNSQGVFKSQAYGLSAAADIAFSEFVLESQPQLAKATKKLQRQVKKLQKGTLIEGSGQASKTGAKSELQLAAAELERTGSKAALIRFNKAKLRGEGKFK